ncbi:NUDIX domain-containing protein [Alicyclobacillus fodiniaquatilis]|uniref:NUDIX domain-containing protein n=1 Tax=Alicyclobacillus fodiniaquatilis TaxID=1661150 RepID=A0ABW4JNV1_9BACL
MAEDIRPIRAAATLLMLRDTEGGVEVLTVKRSAQMRAFPDHLAFPGGVVEHQDHVCAQLCGVGRVRAAEHADDAAFAVAALRETAEEIGWLGGLAHTGDASNYTMVPPNWQTAMLRDKDAFLHEVSARHWRFDLACLRFVGRWLTPLEVQIPTRFDTRFFVMVGHVDECQLRVHSGELAWARWCKPQTLLAGIAANQFKAARPTRAMLEELSHASDVAWCMAQLSVPADTV